MATAEFARVGTARRSAAELLEQRRWWALLIICAAQFIVIVDTSIVAIALPAIQRDLNIAANDLQWVFNAYVVVLAGLLLLGGRLSDLFGARRLFITGFAVLTGASLLAGIAPSGEFLFVSRGLMGLGAALIAPAALSLLFTIFGSRPGELPKALAFFGASAPAGGTAGVFLGGVITEWLTWRWTFLLNIPAGLLVLLVAPMLLPSAARVRGKVDMVGSVLVTAALVIGVYGIVRAPEEGWGSGSTVGLLAASVGLLAAFVAVQARRSEPLVRLGIFRTPNLSAGNTAMALLGGAWIPLWFFLNLYLQQVLGFGAFESGLALLPMTLAIMVLMVGATGRLTALFGIRFNVVAGMAFLVAALLLLALTPTDGSFVQHVLPASILAAIGMSLAYIPTMIASTASVAQEEAGLASGLVNTTYQVGSALGLAAMTAVAASYTDSPALSHINDGFHAAFIGAAGVAFVGGILALVFIRQPRG